MTSQFANALAPHRPCTLSWLALLLALLLNLSLVHSAQAEVGKGSMGATGIANVIAAGQGQTQPSGQFFWSSMGQNGSLAGAAYGYPNAGLMVLILLLVVVGGGIALRGTHRRPQITAPPHPIFAEPSPFAAADYSAYLVRIWREHPHAPWRASAQCARTGEKRYFSTLADLYAFLETQTAAQSAAPPATGLAANPDRPLPPA